MDLSGLAATIAVFVFPAGMIFAGIMDVMTLKIRNAVVLALAGAYFVLAPLAGFSASEIGWSTALAGGVLVLTFSFFAFGWIGGGDAKLAAATALWFGPEHALSYFLLTAVIGGVLTLVLLQMRRLVFPGAFRSIAWLDRLCDGSRGIPYGAAMAPAALVVFPATDWVARAVGA